MEEDFYTQEGILAMQARVIEVVKKLAAEKGVRLDPHGIVFFDGSMSLPERGAPWKLTLHAHGKAEAFLLSVRELRAVKAGWVAMVSPRIRMALTRLSAAR
jgi:hypothetical protein